MRTLRTSLALLLTVLVTNTGLAMSVETSRNEAWFLTDKMAHELRLSSYQWDDVYEVNYDYFRALGSVYGSYTNLDRTRETKLMYILTAAQWNEYLRLSYFTTPAVAVNGNWSFTIYRHYAHDKFFDRNHNVVFSYRGNRSDWANYYRDRHVTTNPDRNRGGGNFNPGGNNKMNPSGNSGLNPGGNKGNNNGNKGNGNMNPGGNKGNGNMAGNSGNKGGNGGNFGTPSSNRNSTTLASRTPNSGNTRSSNTTSRRH